MVQRGIEIEVSPDPTQAEALSGWMGIQRDSWNRMVRIYYMLEGQRSDQELLLKISKGDLPKSFFQIEALARIFSWSFHWVKPKLEAHASKKDQNAHAYGITLGLPTGRTFSVAPRPKEKGPETEKKRREAETKGILDNIQGEMDLLTLCREEAERRRGSYKEPVNPRGHKSKNSEADRAKAAKKAARLESENPFPVPTSTLIHSLFTDERLAEIGEKPWRRNNLEAKKNPHPDAKGYPAAITREVAQNLQKTLDGFYKGTGGRPKFHSKTSSESCRIEPDFTLTETEITITGLKTPLKLTRPARKKKWDLLPPGVYKKGEYTLPAKGTKPPEGQWPGKGFRPCFVTVKKVAGRYFVVLTMDYEKPLVPRTNGLVYGFDPNTRIENRAVVADPEGNIITRLPKDEKGFDLKRFQDSQKKKNHLVKVLGRRLSKCQGPVVMDEKGSLVRGPDGRVLHQTPSNRYRKTQQRLALLSWRISNTRKNLNHTISRRVVETGAQIIIGQRHNVRGMMANRKMAASTQQVGYYALHQMIAYKLEDAGGELRVVGTFEPTTKPCRNCSALNDPGSKENYKCASCGHAVQRDDNSATNQARMLDRSVPWKAAANQSTKGTSAKGEKSVSKDEGNTSRKTDR